MKCFVPEISWHNRDPVYSVDFQPRKGNNEVFYRLASGGADFHVVIWHVTLTPGSSENHFATFECAADLQRHQKTVNAVRFSPNGEYLASGDDDGYIIVWKMRNDVDPPELPGGEDGNERDKESWIAWKVLRGHLQDIYDLAWSPDSAFLVSGSIDNTALLWDVDKRKNLGFLGDHKGFVQGVAWDPKGKYIATLATDRNLRVFDSSKKRQIAKCFKGKLPAALLKDKESAENEKLTKLFHNDTLKTFFRRLTFTPNGDLLITPCGVLENGTKNHDVSYVFTRGSYTKPALHLPSPGLYTVAARSCPILFKLRGTAPSLFALPYRAVYAIATRNALVLHDTEQSLPFGYVANIHYTGITDITWSPDGRLLIASSSEGFCSVITFDEGEIGEEFVQKDASVDIAAIPNSAQKTAERNPGITCQTMSCTDDSVNAEFVNGMEEIMAIDETVELSSSESESVPHSANDKNTIQISNETISKDLTSGNNSKMDVEETITPEVRTPEKENPKYVFLTPTKPLSGGMEFKTPERTRGKKTTFSSETSDDISDLNLSQDSNVSELSIFVVGDESDLISKEEQARRLMSPHQGSPRANSPTRRTPKMSPQGSPITPKSGRRVNLITLSSPKSKRKL